MQVAVETSDVPAVFICVLMFILLSVILRSCNSEYDSSRTFIFYFFPSFYLTPSRDAKITTISAMSHLVCLYIVYLRYIFNKITKWDGTKVVCDSDVNSIRCHLHVDFS